ncbi:MAG: SDR family oxidoreductase, partial [Alphaproteobacteria bacterium]
MVAEHGRMAGKKAIVTGAAGGIGRAIVRAFAAEGAQVLACDISGDGAEETIRLSGLGPADGVAMGCDVAKSADCQAVVAAARNAFGGINVVVNNAAWFMPRRPFAEVSEEDWAKNMAVNLDGPFYMSRHAVPVMTAGGGGSIIHVASQMARVANEGQTSYCTAKGALLMLAK